MNDVLLAMKKAEEKGADLIEIWAGEIIDLDLEKIFTKRKLPLVFNVKGEDEQGCFSGSDEEKVDILLKASLLGAEYCDLSYEMNKKFIQRFLKNKKKRTKLILSHHFWRNTPPLPSLLNLSKQMIKKGAEIVKIVSSEKHKKDFITILRLAENLNKNNIKHISILMGDIGRFSRIIIPKFYGGEFSFASLNDKEKTAIGQLSIDEIKEYL